MKELYCSSFNVNNYSADFTYIGELNGKKYKISSSCGNCYYDFYIYMLTDEKGWSVIASRTEINGIEHIPYNFSEKYKLSTLECNKAVAIRWIEKVMG